MFWFNCFIVVAAAGLTTDDENSDSNTNKLILVVLGLICAVSTTVAILVLCIFCYHRSKNPVPEWKDDPDSRTKVNPESFETKIVPETWIKCAQLKSNHCDTSGTVAIKASVTAFLYIEDEDEFLSTLDKENEHLRLIAREWYNIKKPWESEADAKARMNNDGLPTGFITTCRYTEQLLNTATRVPTPFDSEPVNEKPKTSAPLGVRAEMLHMNFVMDINSYPRYIVSQAPLASEMPLFLMTLAREEVAVIISIVTKSDLERNRAYDYFQGEVGKSRSYASVQVTCSSFDFKSDEVDIRYFEVLKDKDEKAQKFCHIHYKKWTDFSVTSDSSHVIKIKQILDDARKSGKLRESSKILVHCSAGLGRSGALVVLFLAFEWLDKVGWPLNMYSIVKRVRKQRLGAVQTARQYALLFVAVNEYIRKAPAENMRSPIPKLKKQPKSSGLKSTR